MMTSSELLADYVILKLYAPNIKEAQEVMKVIEAKLEEALR